MISKQHIRKRRWKWNVLYHYNFLFMQCEEIHFQPVKSSQFFSKAENASVSLSACVYLRIQQGGESVLKCKPHIFQPLLKCLDSPKILHIQTSIQNKSWYLYSKCVTATLSMRCSIEQLQDGIWHEMWMLLRHRACCILITEWVGFISSSKTRKKKVTVWLSACIYLRTERKGEHVLKCKLNLLWPF